MEEFVSFSIFPKFSLACNQDTISPPPSWDFLPVNITAHLMSIEKSGPQFPRILQTPWSYKHTKTTLKFPLQAFGSNGFQEVEVWVKTLGCSCPHCRNHTDYRSIKRPTLFFWIGMKFLWWMFPGSTCLSLWAGDTWVHLLHPAASPPPQNLAGVSGTVLWPDLLVQSCLSALAWMLES